MSYRVGDTVEVRDGDQWWSAKVLEVSESSALVHFLKFNARHDEWIPMDRLRPGEESSGDSKEFKVGEKVMAPWKYGRKYPAVIKESDSEGNIVVEFYDGVLNSVRPSTVRFLRQEEDAEPVAPVSDNGKPEDTPQGRRKRKEKFNVKELLNIRQQQVKKGASNGSSSGPKPKNNNNNDALPPPKKNSPPKKNGGNRSKMSKEPVLREEIPLLTGKRERKRKKFWDEEDESSLHPSKASKKQSETPSRRASAGGGAPSSLITKEESPRTQHSPSKVKLKTDEELRKLEYLSFDLTQDPALTAKQMVEGRNIPGPGVSIPVESTALPRGWEKRVIQRGLGVTKGKWDVFIQNPSGKSFRSKTELQKHFDEKELNYSIESFDFTLDDTLKRLRQIWKQYVVKPNLKPGEKLSSPIPAKVNRKSLMAKQQPLESSPSSSPVVQRPVVPSNGEIPVNDRVPSPSSSSPSVDSSSLGVLSETGQGFRCKVNNCGKLFRNDKLLCMHVKHYHPERRDSISSVFYVPEHTEETLVNLGKRKSEPSCSLGAPPPEKKLKTLLPEVDFKNKKKSEENFSHEIITLGGRKRNNSSLSVCSSDVERASPVPPTFRISKRRQLQLQRKNLSFTCQSEETCEDNGKADDSNSEVDASVTSADHLTTEEVVNCTCHRLEEDGLMIQCDICLCWQHGGCLEIDSEDQVPEKHVCEICKNPPGRRHLSSRTNIDQDWFKEGKLSVISADSSHRPVDISSKENAFRKLSDLMADLMNLTSVIHSLRVKISVASQKTNNKVFMWSSPWTRTNQEQPPAVKSDIFPSSASNSTSDKLIMDTLNDSNIFMSELAGKVKLENAAAQKEGEDCPKKLHNDESSSYTLESQDGETLSGDVLNGFKGDLGEDSIDPSMIPSVSEVQQLLPSLIEAEGLLQGTQEDFVAPAIIPNLIPEPKRIDREESRLNLIQHIDDVQCEVESRLNTLEESLDRLEKEGDNFSIISSNVVDSYYSKTKSLIQMLLLDLSTARTMLSAL